MPSVRGTDDKDVPSPDHRTMLPFRNHPAARTTRLTQEEAEAVQAALSRRIRLRVGDKVKTSSVRTVLGLIEHSTDHAVAYLKGGTPRDIVGGRDPVDVDVAYSGTTMQKIKAAWEKHYGADLKLSAYIQKIGLIGLGEGDNAVEATTICLAKCKSDSAANQLLIHAPSSILIDPFGRGTADAMQKVWRIPCDNRTEWVKYVRIAVWRMLKFRMRGYEVPDEDMAYIYSQFVSEHDTTPHARRMGSRALANNPLDVLKFACSDIDRLSTRGATTITAHEFLLSLVRQRILTVAPESTHSP